MGLFSAKPGSARGCCPGSDDAASVAVSSAKSMPSLLQKTAGTGLSARARHRS